MTTVHEITKALGATKLAGALSVGVPAVSNAAARGEFPASWYRVVKAKCEAAGIECPDELFGFRAVSEGAEK